MKTIFKGILAVAAMAATDPVLISRHNTNHTAKILFIPRFMIYLPGVWIAM